MVSDADIVRRLTTLLRKADLSVITTTAIRKQLERELGVDLADRKTFIREQVNKYIRSLEPNEDEEAEQLQETEEVDVEEVDGRAADQEDQEEEQEEEDEDEEQEQQEEEGEKEEETRPAKRTRQSTNEPDSKRFKAKIDRAIKARNKVRNRARRWGSSSNFNINGTSKRPSVYDSVLPPHNCLKEVPAMLEDPKPEPSRLPKEKKKRSGGGGGLTKACGLSPELQAIIGEPQLPRTQVVKQLWVYIRENELQDPENKKKILCNDELRGLFGVDSTDIFKMNKLLSKHIWPLDKPSDGYSTVKKPKAEKAATERSKADRKENEKPKKESDRQKTEKKEGGRGKNYGVHPLSDALIEFLGTNEIQMDQHEVVKAVWDYIGANNLQDPADRKTIICDEKLEDLFGCKTFVGFYLKKLLAPHLTG